MALVEVIDKNTGLPALVGEREARVNAHLYTTKKPAAPAAVKAVPAPKKGK